MRALWGASSLCLCLKKKKSLQLWSHFSVKAPEIMLKLFLQGLFWRLQDLQKPWTICLNDIFTFDSGIQSPPGQGWSSKWQCRRWVSENTWGKRSRRGRPQSSAEKKKKRRSRKQVVATPNTREHAWTRRGSPKHTPSMRCRSPATATGSAGRRRRRAARRSHLRSGRLGGSAGRCLRTKRKSCSLDKDHYQGGHFSSRTSQ